MSNELNVLTGLRVLIVEDEAAISMILEEMLIDFGCQVVGPAGRVSEATELASTEGIDIAILDVNLAGEEVYPAAAALQARAIPMIFTTGYGDAGVRADFRSCQIIQKPFRLSELKTMLEAASGKNTAT